MIIQCDSCQTKFKLNESAIKGAGVKVRCTKCQAVFVVTRPEASPPSESVPVVPVETNVEASSDGGLTDEDLGFGVSGADELASKEPAVEEEEPVAEEEEPVAEEEEPTAEEEEPVAEEEEPVAEEKEPVAEEEEPVAEEKEPTAEEKEPTAEEEEPVAEEEEPVAEEKEPEAEEKEPAAEEEEPAAEEEEPAAEEEEPTAEEKEPEAEEEEPVAEEEEPTAEEKEPEDEAGGVAAGAVITGATAGGVSLEESLETPVDEPKVDEGEADWGLGDDVEEEKESAPEEAKEASSETEEGAVNEADWGLDSGGEEEVTDEVIDETDWGLSGEDEPLEDEDIDDDEDWGLGEEDDVADSVEDYTSKLESELGLKEEESAEDESAPVVAAAALTDADDVNKVLSDNDFALGDRPMEDEEPVRVEPSIVASEDKAQEEIAIPQVTLSEEASKDLEQIPPDQAASAMEEPAAKKGKLGVILPILFIIIGIAILYFAGLFQNLMGPAGPPQKTLEIMDLRGSFVQNEDVGELYTLQGRIKNISEKSQEVVGVKVTIFDKSGHALTSKTVSLARLVSNEELKTLSGEELDRHYQDLSKGSIPPRGATPLMVVFSNLPKGMDELEVEVVR